MNFSMHGIPPGQLRQPLRILEIGGHSLFAVAAPEQTEFYWTGLKPRGNAGRALGPINFVRSLIKLRRGEFDLLVVHATLYAPWHPRSFLTVLRDWHVFSPLGLFAIFAWRFVHLFHNVPIAAIDLADTCLIGRHNFFLLRSGKAFFKRELPSDHWQAFQKVFYPSFPGRRWRSKARRIALVEKLKPLSYGMPAVGFGEFTLPTSAPSPEKKTDIFFAGSILGNSTVRTAGLPELRQLERDGYVIDIPNERLPPREFFERMSAAWLAWSPAGLGWDCSRHYEAPLVGTVPLINTPAILRDMPLRDGEHSVYYAVEPGELARTAREALADKPRLRNMARAAATHVLQHHTDRARAERIAIRVLGRWLDGSSVGLKPELLGAGPQPEEAEHNAQLLS